MSVQNRNHFLLFAVLFAAGTLTGWKWHVPVAAEVEVAEKVTRSTRIHLEEKEATGLQKIRSLRSETDRLRATIELARNLPTSEISDWLREGKLTLRPGFAFTLFEKIAFERWAKEQPEEFVEWVMKNGFTDYENEVAAIVRANPEVISAILSRPVTSYARRFLMAISAEADPDFALAELRKILPLTDISSGNMSEFAKIMIAARPSEFRELLAEFPSNFNSFRFEQLLFLDDLAKNFESGLAEAVAHPRGFELMMASYSYEVPSEELSQKILASIPEFPDGWRQQIAAWPMKLTGLLKKGQSLLDLDLSALGFNDEQRGKLIRHGISSAFRDDLAKGVGLLYDHNYSKLEKGKMLSEILFADPSTENLAAIRGAIRDADDLEFFERVMAIANQSAESREQFSPEDVTTPEEFQSAFNDGKISHIVPVTMHWDSQQLSELAKAFPDFNEAAKKQIATEAATNEARSFPAELRSTAIAYLLNNPGAIEVEGWSGENLNAANEVTSQHAVTLMKSDPAEATKWLASLPDTPARLWGKKNLVLNWRNYDPEAVGEWLKTQTESERAEIVSFLKGP